MGLPALAGAGLGLGVVGSLFQAGGQLQAGQAQQAMYDYQAQVARNNAVLAGYNAEYATQVGQATAERTSLETRARIGAQTAAQAANAIDVNTGTAPQVRASTAELGRLAQLTNITDAARTAYGYKVQATADLAQAQLDVAAGQQARTQGRLGAVGSIISGAAGGLSKFSWMQQNAGFDPFGSSGGPVNVLGGVGDESARIYGF